MITAEEARKLSSTKTMMDDIYSYIDSCIEQAANNGENEVSVSIDGCDESWETVLKKRELIEEHYRALGFLVEGHGYSRATTSDEFTIKW